MDLLSEERDLNVKEGDYIRCENYHGVVTGYVGELNGRLYLRCDSGYSDEWLDFCHNIEKIEKEKMTPTNSRGEFFEPGELFIYENGDSFEIGEVKRENNTEDGYFCYYHSGDTAANTPVENMHKLVNSYVIEKNTLGGK